MGSPVCDHEGTPLPYERPFTHGWDGNPAHTNIGIGRCPVCKYGPETPRNLGYHLLHTHRMTVQQAATCLINGTWPELDEDLRVKIAVDGDELPV